MPRLVGSLLLLVCALAVPADAATITSEREISDRVLELTVATESFAGGTTKVEVILPRRYDRTSRRWPATYFTAGTMNSQATFRTLIDGVGLTKDYPSLVVSGDSNSGYWSDWYNAGAFGPPKYETFLVGELIPLIEARFRVVPSRSQRAIFGASMGGYGALMLAARHPQTFAAAASMSGAVDSNLEPNGTVLSMSSTLDGAPADAIYGPRSEQEVRWRGHNPWDLAENLRGIDLQVRTANGVPAPGIGENPVSADSVSCAVELGVWQASVSLHKRLDALGVPHEYRDYGPGCHSSANFTRETADILAHFRRYLRSPERVPASFKHRSIEPDFTAYGWRVEADPARALEFMEIAASPAGATLTGSGLTTVTTAPLFRGSRKVDVDGRPTPVRGGRVRFEVDLGPAHTAQQYTFGAEGEFKRGAVQLAPHARLIIARLGSRVCLRATGGAVHAVRVRAGGRSARVARIRSGGRACRRLPGGPVSARGRDAFGHSVRAAGRP